MKNAILRDIISFSLARQKTFDKMTYLFKGLLFAPFLIMSSNKKSESKDMASSISQAGDDIYPLF